RLRQLVAEPLLGPADQGVGERRAGEVIGVVPERVQLRLVVPEVSHRLRLLAAHRFPADGVTLRLPFQIASTSSGGLLRMASSASFSRSWRRRRYASRGAGTPGRRANDSRRSFVSIRPLPCVSRSPFAFRK